MEKMITSGHQRFILKRKFGVSENCEKGREEERNVKKRFSCPGNDHQMVNFSLITAALAGDVNIVSYLLTKRANIEFIRDDGMTPLKAAICSNSFHTVETLLICRVQVEVEDPSSLKVDSPLHLALKTGFIPSPLIGCDKWDAKFLLDTNIIKLLIDHGASVNTKCSAGYSPLSLAVSSNRDSVVKHLIRKGANVNQVDDKCCESPLMQACIVGNVHIVKCLLQKGAYIDATDIYDYSPLMLATEHKKYQVVSILLEEGADVNQSSDIDGKNALILAIESNSCDIVNTLLWYEADVNSSNPIYSHGTTALMLAARLGHKEIVEALLDFSADVTIKNQNGDTALSVCSSEDILQILRS